MSSFRSSRPEVFLEINVLKICSKFTGEDQCRSVISVKFSSCLNNFIKITLWHGCSPVNLLHIFRTSFPRKTSGRLLLIVKFILKSRAVCVIEIRQKKIMCCGFSSKTTKTRSIYWVFKILSKFIFMLVT